MNSSFVGRRSAITYGKCKEKSCANIGICETKLI